MKCVGNRECIVHENKEEGADYNVKSLVLWQYEDNTMKHTGKRPEGTEARSDVKERGVGEPGTV